MFRFQCPKCGFGDQNTKQRRTNSMRARAGVQEVTTSVVGMRASGGGPGAGRPRVEHCTDEHRQQQRTQPASSENIGLLRTSRAGARLRRGLPPSRVPPAALRAGGGCRGLTSRRTHHAGDEGFDLGRGLLTVIDQVGTLRRFDGTRRIGSRSAGGLPRSFRGADRSVVAGVSALPHRHHGGDRLHRADQTLPAGSGYIMTRDRDPARTNSNCPPGCVRSQS